MTLKVRLMIYHKYALQIKILDRIMVHELHAYLGVLYNVTAIKLQLSTVSTRGETF